MDVADGFATRLCLLDDAHEHHGVVDTLRIHAGRDGPRSGWCRLKRQSGSLGSARVQHLVPLLNVLYLTPGSPANGPSGLDTEYLRLARGLDALNDHTLAVRDPTVATSKVELNMVEPRRLENTVVERGSLNWLEQRR